MALVTCGVKYANLSSFIRYWKLVLQSSKQIQKLCQGHIENLEKLIQNSFLKFALRL